MSGIHSRRSLPRLSRTTLRDWFEAREPHEAAGDRGLLYLFCDEFTNYVDTHVGIAAVELLERLGYRVEIPEHLESGRGAISGGFLRDAQEIANRNVELLHKRVSFGVPLVGVEPSALLTLVDEYPTLVSPHLQKQATELSQNCLLLDEFLSREMARPRVFSKFFCEDHLKIRLHAHCHQKALRSLRPTIRMLQLPKNYQVKLIPSGCCGMAGSFGYEKEHYDVSMQIGELVLFPTIREENEDVVIAAPGTSCRQQILDGTGRRALHPVEILRDALVDD